MDNEDEDIVEVLNQGEAAADHEQAQGLTEAEENQEAMEASNSDHVGVEVEGSSSATRGAVSILLSRLRRFPQRASDTARWAHTDTGEEYPCLRCVCGHPCAFSQDVITQQYTTLESHVYSYMLDIFDDVEAPAYSATNPNDNRFDVVCFKPDEVRHRVYINGDATPEHSWYPPFWWRFVSCLQCRTLLGWAFYSEDKQQGCISRYPEFLGLIVTNLRPQKSKIPSRARLENMRTRMQNHVNVIANLIDSYNIPYAEIADEVDFSAEEDASDARTVDALVGEAASMETENEEHDEVMQNASRLDDVSDSRPHDRGDAEDDM
uniref:CULT domain-containing protein n=1 Tax=Aplanochytrium stocchinoi TaxID=215587 RepID=A0A7S3UXY5_9STRA